MKFRRRSDIVEVEVITEDDGQKIAGWCGGTWYEGAKTMVVSTSDGPVSAEPGDYVIKGTTGTFSLLHAEEFERSYDHVLDDKDSGLVAHAKRELDLVGMTDDSDGKSKLGREGLLDLIRQFASQGHSGTSAAWMMNMFVRLVMFSPLTELTSDEDEWNEVGGGVWQSTRNSEAFSKDRGQTYTLLSEEHDARRASTQIPVHTSRVKEEDGAS